MEERDHRGISRDEIVRRLRVYEDLTEFVAEYDWASADGGEEVLKQVREILNRGKERT